jgi:hypothetical protein
VSASWITAIFLAPVVLVVIAMLGFEAGIRFERARERRKETR